MATARRLFREKAFNEIGINDLCREAGVVKGSFYHFFPSKQSLLDAVIERNRLCIIDALQSSRAAGSDGRSRIMAHLSAILDSAAAQAESTGRVLGCHIGALASELAGSNEPARAASSRALEDWRALLEALIREGREDGSIARSVDPAATAATLLAVIQGMSTLGRSFNSPEMLTAIAGTAVKRLLPIRMA